MHTPSSDIATLPRREALRWAIAWALGFCWASVQPEITGGVLVIVGSSLAGGLWTDAWRQSAGRCLLVASLWWWGWVWPLRQVMVDFGLPDGRWFLLGAAQSLWWALALITSLAVGRRWPLAGGLLWTAFHGLASDFTLLPVTLQLPASLVPGATMILPWLGSATLMGLLLHASLVLWQRRSGWALLVWLGAIAGGPWVGGASQPIQVQLVSTDVGPFQGRRASLYEPRMRALAPLLRTDAVELVVTGESAWPIDEPPGGRVHADVLLGASAPGVHAGSSWWLSPTRASARIPKPRPVPGVEMPSRVAGGAPATVRVADQVFGVLQCYSGWSAFGPAPLPAEQTGWIWQANDAWLTPPLARWHWLAARQLALDTHLPVVRAGQSGWSGVWTPSGVSGAALDFVEGSGKLTRPRSLAVQVVPGRPRSLPARWLGLLMTTGCLLLARRRLRPRPR